MEFYTLIALGLIVVLAAGFIQGLTSFGFALLSLPLLTQFIPLQEVVPIVVILSLCTNIFIFIHSRQDAELRKIWILILSSLAAAPVGTYLLLYLDSNLLKLCTGVLITLFAFILLSGKSVPVQNERLAYVPVGITSGILNGSISMSGPPVALFLSNQGVGKETFRANISAYAILLNLITVCTYLYGGLITSEVIRYTSWFVPGMFIGVFIGIHAVKRLNDKLFKRIALWLIVLSGGWTMITALGII